MKKVLLTLVTVLAVAAVFTGVAASTPDAGKLVLSGFPCSVIDGNGALFTTTNSEQWEFQNRAVLRCWGNGAPYTGPNPPFFWNTTNWPPPTGGGQCGTFFGTTSDWYDKVGRNGLSQLVCTVTFPAGGGSSSDGLGVG